MAAYGPRGEQPRREGGARFEVLSIKRVTSAGTGEILATEGCVLQAFLWGAGASGSVQANSNRGGGSGAASVAIAKLRPGQRVPYVVGAGGSSQTAAPNPGSDGGDTWVRLPTGLIVTAGGGKATGAGGLASGGLINKHGTASGTNNSAGAPAPSLSEYSNFTDFVGGAGSAYGTGSGAGGAPGAGSGGSDGGGPSGIGGVGRLIYVLSRLA